MASPLRLTITGRLDDATADAAWHAVSDEFDRCDQAMSRFRDDSAITLLNHSAGGDALVVDDRLYRALAASHRAWRLTGGRFDPRILADLERIGYAGAPIRDSRRPVDRAVPVENDSETRWLERCPRDRAVGLAEPIDLGGIGKGLALRWAWRRLGSVIGESFGTRVGALLDAGGDLVTGGPSPDGGPWRLGLEDPRGGDEPLAVIGLEAGSLCTSSVLVNRWHTQERRTVHHLIDPATREPGGPGLLSVTVAAPDPAWGEVWSKALFLEGATQIGERARGRGLRVWWVGEDGTLWMTPGARPLTIWAAAEG
jgi:thiamine biosynthesis lipoprotein